MTQQGKLLGHVVRVDKSDPMRMATIDDRLETPGVFKKRVGRPRLGWVTENCKWIYGKTLLKDWDPENEDGCIDDIIKRAVARKYREGWDVKLC